MSWEIYSFMSEMYIWYFFEEKNGQEWETNNQNSGKH